MVCYARPAGRFAALLIVALLVFGPEKLPEGGRRSEGIPHAVESRAPRSLGQQRPQPLGRFQAVAEDAELGRAHPSSRDARAGFAPTRGTHVAGPEKELS